MKPNYEVGTNQNVDACLKGIYLDGAGNQPHTAVALARQSGAWLAPETLLQHGCPHTRALAQLTGDAATEYRARNSYALAQEAEALRAAEALRSWAAVDAPVVDLGAERERERARGEWIATRARALAALAEAERLRSFEAAAAVEWDAAHRRAPLANGKPARKVVRHV